MCESPTFHCGFITPPFLWKYSINLIANHVTMKGDKLLYENKGQNCTVLFWILYKEARIFKVMIMMALYIFDVDPIVVISPYTLQISCLIKCCVIASLYCLILSHNFNSILPHRILIYCFLSSLFLSFCNISLPGWQNLRAHGHAVPVKETQVQ